MKEWIKSSFRNRVFITVLLVTLLPMLLWGTFLLGPVMAGRYAYPFVCTLPVLAAGPGADRKKTP